MPPGPTGNPLLAGFSDLQTSLPWVFPRGSAGRPGARRTFEGRARRNTATRDDATKKSPGEGFKRAWPPLIKMDETVKARMEKLFGGSER